MPHYGRAANLIGALGLLFTLKIRLNSNNPGFSFTISARLLVSCLWFFSSTGTGSTWRIFLAIVSLPPPRHLWPSAKCSACPLLIFVRRRIATCWPIWTTHGACSRVTWARGSAAASWWFTANHFCLCGFPLKKKKNFVNSRRGINDTIPKINGNNTQ